MATESVYCLLIVGVLCGFCNGWRAVPANEAMYALRSADAGIDPEDLEGLSDHQLPRNTLHSTYKFGYCTPQATKRQYLRTTLNVTFENKEDTQADYMYIITDLNTQRFRLQCVVMKLYVPRKFEFWRSRLPIYYCQGQLYILMFNTVHRLAMHEFYLQYKLNMAVNIYFEFYHPEFI